MNKADWHAAASKGELPTDEVVVIEICDGADCAPSVCAFFQDVELDPFMVVYHSDGTIHFDTSDLAYFITDQEQVERIAQEAETAAVYHKMLAPLLDLKTDTWANYQHILTHKAPD
jgi:hypothetical protein